MDNLPSSPACMRNSQPIWERLSSYLPESGRVLEVGSGTAEHVVYFAVRSPKNLQWQPSDRNEYLNLIRKRCELAGLANVLPPLELDVNATWPELESNSPFDVIYTANTLHIMSFNEVKNFFAKVSKHLQRPNGVLVIYGPFRYHGKYTSQSNQAFDQHLAEQNPNSAIRDYYDIEELAKKAGLRAIADHPMPANNQLLVFQSV